MTTYCDLSDLPTDQCACRVHAPAQPPQRDQDPAQPSAGTLARFPATCPECDDDITPGVDLIKHSVLSGWVHAQCC